MTVITFLNSTLLRHLVALAALMVVLVAGGTAQAATARTSRKFFASPEEAVQSLVAAAKNNDKKGLLAILGPGSQPIVSSGDPVADRNGRDRFVTLYEEKHLIEGVETGRALLTIGNEEFRFPVPVVKQGESWYFDARAGREELLNRRIGRNELEVIDVVRE